MIQDRIRALGLRCSEEGRLLLPPDLLQQLTVESVLGSLHLLCRCVVRALYDVQKGKLEDGAVSWILHNIVQKLPDTGKQSSAQAEQCVDTLHRQSPLEREFLTVTECRNCGQAQQCADALRLRLGQKTTVSGGSNQAGECPSGLDDRRDSPAIHEDRRGLVRAPGVRSQVPSQTEIDSFNPGD